MKTPILIISNEKKQSLYSLPTLFLDATIFTLVLMNIWYWTDFILAYNNANQDPAMLSTDGVSDNVILHLAQLEKIADAHGSSRSVDNGHNASVDYVISHLMKYDSLKYWTESVPIKVQRDSAPPSLTFNLPDYKLDLTPRIDVAVVPGSGSMKVKHIKPFLMTSCVASIFPADEWAAVISTTKLADCNACDLMGLAYSGQAKAVIFYTPLEENGYPHLLPPSPGRCSRNPANLAIMSQIGILSLSAKYGFKLLESMVNLEFSFDMDISSKYETVISRNLLAESINGDPTKIILFGSHLDSVPAGPGVNDDGSGAMATLELARIFHESKLAKTTVQKVRFAWWTGEEIGLLGSKHYTSTISPQLLSAHKMTVDTDMIMSPNFVRGIWDASLLPPGELRDACMIIGSVFADWFRIRGLETVKFPFNGRSDFAPFMDKGVPSGGVITGEDEIKTIEEAGVFGGIAGMVLDPCYHQDCDRLMNLQGPSMIILKENVQVLAYALEVFSKTSISFSMQNNDTLGIKYFPVEALQARNAKAVPFGTESEGETQVYRSSLSKNLIAEFPKIETVHQLLENSIARYSERPCLGTRYLSNGKWSAYQFKSYRQLAEDRRYFGSALKSIHRDLVKNDDPWFLGIFAINRYEWVVADMGASAYNIPFVALYDTLGPDTTEFILNHADVPIVLTSIDKVSTLLDIASKTKLKVIIVMDMQPIDVGLLNVFVTWGAQKDITVLTLTSVLEIGKKNVIEFTPPTADDVFCLCYTSGTTGNPKGAILTHRNMISTVHAGLIQMEFTPMDVHISYLPLAHIFERMMMLMTLGNGGSAGFFRGDVALLVEDIGCLSPTIFPSVPRLLNRIYDKIIAGAVHSGSAVKAALFNRAVSDKTFHLYQNGSLTHSIWDPLVFNKVKALLGGRVRLVVSASAPITGSTLEFLRIALGCQVLEAYGQTESCGGLTASWPGDYTVGHVGNPLCNTEIKLVSVPEMQYHAKDLKGEIWARGPGVFKGYHKDLAKTKETITSDGWLMTGDIGTIDSVGHLSIVDRKKNIFKLSQGEYVAPEKLENIFVKSPFVAQIYVHGDSLQNDLVAIVVPDAEFCVKWAVSKQILPANTPAPDPTSPGKLPSASIIALSTNPELVAAIVSDLRKFGVASKVRGFEFIKSIHVDANTFSVENGLMTPTFKIKRNEVAIKYRDAIDGMYRVINSVPTRSKL